MNDLADGSTEFRPHNANICFAGKTGDYFRIWIVNMALTIVTLGIYSAWAKVRKLRYFYGNTELEGATFDYHARPQAILFGRIIAVVLLGFYWLLSYYWAAAGFALILLIMALIPVLVVRAHVFQLNNSSYRQIRFGFEPNYKGAFGAYYGGALVSVLTLGLGTPQALYMRHRFAIDNSRFGRTPLSFSGQSGTFFSIVYSAAGLAILGMISVVLVTMPLSSMLSGLTAGGPASTGFFVAEVITALPVFVVYGAIGVYTTVRIRNYVWMQTKLDTNTFVSNLSVRHMCWLYLSNVIAIVFTVGLAVPWAQIRLARYRAECTEVVLNRDWKEFVAAERERASALGEEIGEAFDVGIDLAI